MMVLWKWSGPCPPTATAVALANDVLKEGMAVNAWVKELFHPVHFSQRVGHAAARPPRSLMCKWKETRSSKTDSGISFLFLLKNTCIYFVFSLLSDRLDLFFFSFVFSNRQQMCWFATGSASTPSTADRCLTQQLNRRKVGRAGSVKAERPPHPGFSLSHLRRLLELYTPFTTLFISSLPVSWIALSAIPYRDLLYFNNPSIESRSGCSYTWLILASAWF